MNNSSWRILITGASGTVGTALCRGLRDRRITRASLPWVDMRRYAMVKQATRNHDIAIHLAWNVKAENFCQANCSADNTAMFINMYRAAVENGLRRVIMASSVHADDFHGWKETATLTVRPQPKPTSAYGIHKVFMESLGRHYASLGLEVVCIRFGAVTRDNKPPENSQADRAVFLHHDDCVALISAILNAQAVPDRFAVMNAVSDTNARIHDISNPFGWQPPRRALD